jgi:thioesterase-3
MEPSITDIKVRGYHLDLFGHVNNARFLEFLEEARWEFVEGTMDLTEWQKRGIGFSIVNININYKRPAFMGETIEVRTSMAKLGKTSGTVHQKIVLKGTETLIVDADVTFVMVDINKNKPIPLDGDIRAAFESLI